MRRTAFIGLGSNLENPAAQLQSALRDLGRMPQTEVLAQSSFYRSAPVGYLDQPDFCNAVAKLSTGLAPHQLLQQLLEIEHAHGRERTFRNAPRTLDLDVLLYGELQLDEPGLTLPHPQMHLRAFVLQPLLEIAPDCVVPGQGAVESLLSACSHQTLERMDHVAAG
jgi:2-amino-4-hydroxy-6-hydroxymethyldihydropteridine diphosphokinase